MTQTSIHASLQAEIDSLAPWFHNLHLPDGTQTFPNHWLGDFPAFKWQQIEPHIPADLTGCTCLDIGCNAGFYSFKLAQRGAKVLGIDVDPHYLRQARWAARQFNLQDHVTFEQMQIYDLAHRPQTFDLVLFLGVFYHLRYPLLALDIIAQRVNKLMLFQTLSMAGESVETDTWDRNLNDRTDLDRTGWPKMAFIEHKFGGDPTNWWIANHAAIEAMIRSAGLKITGHPAHEFYLCQPDPARPSCMTTWNRAEYQSATGTRPAGEAENAKQ